MYSMQKEKKKKSESHKTDNYFEPNQLTENILNIC